MRRPVLVSRRAAEVVTALLDPVRQGRFLDRVLELSCRRPLCLALAGAIAVVDHTFHQQALGFLPRAGMDEPCHLATAVVMLGAYVRTRGRPPGRVLSAAMLTSSAAIDADHLPLLSGSRLLTEGTPRPYTHALWFLGLLTAIWATARRRDRARGRARAASQLAAGAALGVSAHFLRDLATAPIALWWPLSDVGAQMPYGWYAGALLVLAVVPPAVGRQGRSRWQAPGTSRAGRARRASRDDDPHGVLGPEPNDASGESRDH